MYCSMSSARFRLSKAALLVIGALSIISTMGTAPVHAQSIVYDSTSGPYSSFAASSGVLGIDDYTTTLNGSSFLLTQLRFIGGVTTAGGVLQFQFQNASGTPTASFNVTFTNAGNFIYDVPASFFSTGSPVAIPTSGRLQISTIGSTQGQWFLTSTAPSIGSNNPAFGSGAGQTPALYQAFSLTSAAPEPGTLSLILLGFAVPAIRLVTRRSTQSSF